MNIATVVIIISPCNCRTWKTRLARIQQSSDFVLVKQKEDKNFFSWCEPCFFCSLDTLSNKAQEQPTLAYCLIHFYSPPWHCRIYSSMDQNAVYQLFVSTYHPDPNVHKQAELNIRNVSTCFILSTRSLIPLDSSRLRLIMVSFPLSFKFWLLRNLNSAHAKLVK